MTVAGWSIMIVSITGVFSLCVFCVSRVLSLPPNVAEEHLKAPLDIDTHDLES
jgi:hypothetical protein